MPQTPEQRHMPNMHACSSHAFIANPLTVVHMGNHGHVPDVGVLLHHPSDVIDSEFLEQGSRQAECWEASKPKLIAADARRYMTEDSGTVDCSCVDSSELAQLAWETSCLDGQRRVS